MTGILQEQFCVGWNYPQPPRRNGGVARGDMDVLHKFITGFTVQVFGIRF